MSATKVDLSRLVPPWRELEPTGKLSERQILKRLDSEARAAAEWGSDKAAALLVISVGNWLLLSVPKVSDDAINRLNALLGRYEGPATESRRFG